MRESKSQSWLSWTLVLLFQIVPYILFYVGIFLWYVNDSTSEQLTAARYIRKKNILYVCIITFQNNTCYRFGDMVFIITQIH